MAASMFLDAEVLMNSIKVNYVDRVYEQLKKMITEHELKPNEQLFIAKLSVRLNVSTTPIREALNRLLNEKLVVKGHNRGFFTRGMDEQEQRELIMLREALLLWAIRLYLARPDEAVQGFVYAKWQAFTQAEEPEHKPSSVLLDKALFDLIFASVGNVQLSHLYQNCMARCGYAWYTFVGHRPYAAFYAEHYQHLLAALWARDLSCCESLIQEGSHKLLESQHIALLCFNGGANEAP